MIYLRFRAIDSLTGKNHETDTRVRAGNYIWRDRGLPFDIIEATDDDPN